MAINYQLIGKRISTRRKELHITQEQLAEQLDISTAFISKIEGGKTRLSLDRLAQICRFLDMTPAQLIDGCDVSSKSYMIPEIAKLLDECPKELMPLVKDVLTDIIQHHKNT